MGGSTKGRSGPHITFFAQTGKATSAELVELYIQRILAVNPSLNAVVKYRFEEARKEAREADARLGSARNGGAELPPFLGVPCTVKECFDLTGFPNTSGLLARANAVAESDSTCVARMREAGFVILGTTNVSELCMWMESNNRVYGRTNNPFDLSCTPGGSSGGQAAIIAACASPVGLASDVGGSIRMPAFFCGIFGHKPTGGVVPNTGTWPPAYNAVDRYCQPGPLARHSEDLWPYLNVLAGSDGQTKEQLTTLPWKENPHFRPEAVDVSSLTIYSCESARAPFVSPVDPELIAAQRRTVRYLRGLGCRVEEISLPELRQSFDLWSSSMTAADTTPFKKLMAQGRKSVWFVAELIKFCAGKSEFTLPGIILSLVEDASALTPGRTKRFAAAAKEFSARLSEKLGDNAVLLYPPHPVPAPRHNWPMTRPFNWVYTAIFNALEFGLPLGVQVVAGHGRDHLSIAVAVALEKGGVAGYQPPRSLPSIPPGALAVHPLQGPGMPTRQPAKLRHWGPERRTSAK